MKTLYIDTHLWNVTIVLFENGKVIRKEEIVGKKNNSTLIFPTIEKVLNDEKVDSIIVVNGPGSFTGVRLGVVIAKTLGYLWHVPIRVVSSLECMAVCSDNKYVAINDGNGYFVAKFNEEMDLISDYRYLDSDDVDENILVTDVVLDYEAIYRYVMKKESVESHVVNPIYVKKIGVEK